MTRSSVFLRRPTCIQKTGAFHKVAKLLMPPAIPRNRTEHSTTRSQGRQAISHRDTRQQQRSKVTLTALTTHQERTTQGEHQQAGGEGRTCLPASVPPRGGGPNCLGSSRARGGKPASTSTPKASIAVNTPRRRCARSGAARGPASARGTCGRSCGTS
jgi:hypothetical protein